MRAFVLLVLLCVALPVHAAVENASSRNGPHCATDGSGRTCATTYEKRVGYAADDGSGGVWFVEQTRFSEGNHSSTSPNSWNSTSHGYGVRARSGTHTAEATVALREYSASEETGGRTRRTNDNGAEARVQASDLPVEPPGASVTERRVEAGYHHCFVEVDDRTLVDVPCGPEILEESLLP